MNEPLPPETIVPLDDPASGLRGFIVIDSTRRGPAAGGCRLWTYDDEAAACRDAARLAAGMTLKTALADLPLGRGKAVLMRPEGAFDRPALFRALGRVVAKLEGTYLTAEDVGTAVDDMGEVSRSTRYVAGLAAMPGRPGGDPSPWTALGVFRAMEVAVARRLGRGLADVTVAVQGVGHVGFALCELLHAAGSRLIIAECRSELAARAAVSFGAQLASSSTILTAQADVFAPCALGGVLTKAVVPGLRAQVVCGAANNQLASSDVGDLLADRDVLYAPDYLVNAGGIVNVAAEHLGWSLAEVEQRVDAIGGRLNALLDTAEAERITPDRAANAMAQRSVASGSRKGAGRTGGVTITCSATPSEPHRRRSCCCVSLICSHSGTFFPQR